MKPDSWKEECIHKGKWEWYPKNPQAFVDKYGKLLRIATIHETLGPNFKPLIMIPCPGGFRARVFK